MDCRITRGFLQTNFIYSSELLGEAWTWAKLHISYLQQRQAEDFKVIPVPFMAWGFIFLAGKNGENGL